ncbi:MAG: hypothetical protein U1F25_00520 [Rubrivivax sp.]
MHHLSAHTEGLDLSALLAGTPQTRLGGEMQVQAAARDAPVSVRLSLVNGDGPLERTPATGGAPDAGSARPRTGAARAHRAGAVRSALADASGAAAKKPHRRQRRVERAPANARSACWLPARRLDGRAPAMTLAGPLKLALQGCSPSARQSERPRPLSGSGKLDLEERLEGITTQRQAAVTVRARATPAPAGSSCAIARCARARPKRWRG